MAAALWRTESDHGYIRAFMRVIGAVIPATYLPAAIVVARSDVCDGHLFANPKLSTENTEQFANDA